MKEVHPNLLNPLATGLDALHEGCRGTFLADHPHVTARPGLVWINFHSNQWSVIPEISLFQHR